MRIDVITLFPESLERLADLGVTGRAIREGQVVLNTWNPRDLATDRHRTVDDKPFGGGPGMLMKTEPLMASIAAARQAVAEKQQTGESAKVIYLSPQGKTLKQDAIIDLAQRESMVVAIRA